MGGNMGLTISVCIQQEAILNTVVREGLTVNVVRWRHSRQEYLGNRDSMKGPWYGYAGLYRSGLAHSASPQQPWPYDSPREFIKHTGPWRFLINWQLIGRTCPRGRPQNHRLHAKMSPPHPFPSPFSPVNRGQKSTVHKHSWWFLSGKFEKHRFS